MERRQMKASESEERFGRLYENMDERELASLVIV